MRLINLIKILCLSLPAFIFISCSNGSSSSSSSPQIQYTTLNYTNGAPGSSTGLTGIRQVANSSDVYITGSYVESGSNGTLYQGPVTGGGTYYIYNYPSESGATVAGTNVYSADNVSISIAQEESPIIQLVGTYTTTESGSAHAFGFLYTGLVTNGNESIGHWEPINYPSGQTLDSSTVQNTYPHSIMGNLIGGNYNTLTLAGNAFVYDVIAQTYTTLIPESGARYSSIYGVWQNESTSYTVAGGYSMFLESGTSVGFVADYDSAHPELGLTNVMTYTYNNSKSGILDTHFEGITTDGGTGYNLAAGWALTSGTIGSSFVHIARNSNGSFQSTAKWINVTYPGAITTTGDTVYQNYLLGIYVESSGATQTNGYVATIPTSWY